MKYIGICAAPDGYLYCSPCDTPTVLVFEPVTLCLSFRVELEQET